MLSFYRWLLYLYPSLCRREFADEMISVLRDAHADVSAGSVKERISFRVRETLGCLPVLCGSIPASLAVAINRFHSGGSTCAQNFVSSGPQSS